MFGIESKHSIPLIGRGLLAGAVLSLLSGCAGMGQKDSNTDRHSAGHEPSRAERVFLYQSRVADALLNRYPLLEVFEDADPALIAAEARMTETCSPLTRAVLTKLEGGQLSLGLRFKVFTTIDDCERAAQRMDRMLQQSSGKSGQTRAI